MKEIVQVPIKLVNGVKWADLCAFGLSHEIVCEIFKLGKDQSFAGGHRVRTLKCKKNVHFKVPVGAEVDISGVVPAEVPRRNQR